MFSLGVATMLPAANIWEKFGGHRDTMGEKKKKEKTLSKNERKESRRYGFTRRPRLKCSSSSSNGNSSNSNSSNSRSEWRPLKVSDLSHVWF